MNICSKVLICLSSLVAPLQAQCCGGAYDQAVLSSDGRYRVVAKSQTGTGHTSHGPYHFRFTTYRVADKPKRGAAPAKDTELGSFDRHWASDEHFNMRIIVSPTGNGFVLDCGMQEEIHFFAPDGRMLREISCIFRQHTVNLRRATEWQKHCVGLSANAMPRRQSELWIPLAQIVGPELEAQVDKPGYVPIGKNAKPIWTPLAASEKRWLMSMLTWSSARGKREAAAVQRSIAALLAEPRDSGWREPLIGLGLSALPLVRAELAKATNEDSRAALAAVIARIDERLCGHKEPWRNRELLAAVAEHPDKELRNCALQQLRALAQK